MNRIKVVTVVGTRPEIIRLSRVLARLDESPSIEHISIHTGQNYDFELNEIFYQDLEIRKPDFFLEAAGSNAVQTVGQILMKIDPLLDQIKPDAILVLGDTNSCLVAIAARKSRIPLFHMEAGNRCFDLRVPEESNRRIVDHISDINLTYSDIAREYLLKEGLPADRVIKTGSPMMEVLSYYQKKIQSSNILLELNLEKERYFLVSCHREENVNDYCQFMKFIDVLNLLAVKYSMPIIVSTHPRTRKQIEKYDVKVNKLVYFSKPISFSDYNALQLNAFVVLSDSGTISEESSIMNFPALNIRESHERPEAMEEAAVMMVGLNSDRILQAIEVVKVQDRIQRQFQIVKDYSFTNVSDKVVRIIISYIDYVKRISWGVVHESNSN